MQIVIDVPEQYLLDDTVESLTDRFKLYTALMMFRTGKISAGAACELAGVDRYTFMAACRRHDIPVVNYPPEELEAELKWLTDHESSSQ